MLESDVQDVHKPDNGQLDITSIVITIVGTTVHEEGPHQREDKVATNLSELLQGKHYTTYELEIFFIETEEKIILHKRYSQFLALHAALKSYFGTKTLPHFPSPKTIYKMDPHVVSERQHQLQQYIRELQTLPDVFKSFHVQLFLERVRVDGKVCLITGASGGIGQQTALSLAMMGAHVIMACRSAEKSNPIVEQIKKDSGNTNVEFMKLDLSSLQSVRDFVSEFKTKGLALNILILNAGVLGDQGLTHDGFEMAFGVNYLGHFMLTKLLMDVLHNSVPARVVIVASEEHYNVKSIPYDKVKTAATITTALEAYQVSKLACILFCLELTRRTENTGILVSAVSPGTVATNLFRNLPAVVEKVLKQFTSTIEEGIRPILYCAVSDEMKSETGHHIVSTCRRKLPNPVCQDPEVSATLWNMSESWLTDILMSKSLIF